MGNKNSRVVPEMEITCSICLEEKKDVYLAKHLDPSLKHSSHVFCMTCISNWFAKSGSRSCPLCRQEISFMDFNIKGDRKYDRLRILYKFFAKLYGMKYIPEKYRNDKKFMIELVKIDGLYLKYASDELKDDIEVVGNAVTQDGMSLKYASENMKRNRDIVMIAVKECGMALRFANRFKCDKEIVLEAIKTHAYAFIFINDCFLYDSGDRDIMRTIEQSLYNKRKNNNLDFRIRF